jgi:hypothetical protein
MSNQMGGAELGALNVNEFCTKYRIGRTRFYEEIKAGNLRAVKCGARTLILNRDANAWENNLSAVNRQLSSAA